MAWPMDVRTPSMRPSTDFGGGGGAGGVSRGRRGRSSAMSFGFSKTKAGSTRPATVAGHAPASSPVRRNGASSAMSGGSGFGFALGSASTADDGGSAARAPAPVPAPPSRARTTSARGAHTPSLLAGALPGGPGTPRSVALLFEVRLKELLMMAAPAVPVTADDSVAPSADIPSEEQALGALRLLKDVAAAAGSLGPVLMGLRRLLKRCVINNGEYMSKPGGPVGSGALAPIPHFVAVERLRAEREVMHGRRLELQAQIDALEAEAKDLRKTQREAVLDKEDAQKALRDAGKAMDALRAQVEGAVASRRGDRADAATEVIALHRELEGLRKAHQRDHGELLALRAYRDKQEGIRKLFADMENTRRVAEGRATIRGGPHDGESALVAVPEYGIGVPHGSGGAGLVTSGAPGSPRADSRAAGASLARGGRSESPAGAGSRGSSAGGGGGHRFGARRGLADVEDLSLITEFDVRPVPFSATLADAISNSMALEKELWTMLNIRVRQFEQAVQPLAPSAAARVRSLFAAEAQEMLTEIDALRKHVHDMRNTPDWADARGSHPEEVPLAPLPKGPLWEGYKARGGSTPAIALTASRADVLQFASRMLSHKLELELAEVAELQAASALDADAHDLSGGGSRSGRPPPQPPGVRRAAPRGAAAHSDTDGGGGAIATPLHEFFYSYLEGQYGFMRLALLVAYAILVAVEAHAMSHPMIEMFARAMVGEIDDSCWRYLLTVNASLGSSASSMAAATDLAAVAHVLYPPPLTPENLTAWADSVMAAKADDDEEAQTRVASGDAGDPRAATAGRVGTRGSPASRGSPRAGAAGGAAAVAEPVRRGDGGPEDGLTLDTFNRAVCRQVMSSAEPRVTYYARTLLSRDFHSAKALRLLDFQNAMRELVPACSRRVVTRYFVSIVNAMEAAPKSPVPIARLAPLTAYLSMLSHPTFLAARRALR